MYITEHHRYISLLKKPKVHNLKGYLDVGTKVIKKWGYADDMAMLAIPSQFFQRLFIFVFDCCVRVQGDCYTPKIKNTHSRKS